MNFRTKLYAAALLALGGLVVAGLAQASEITGNLNTGLSTTGVNGVVIVPPTANPIAGTYTSAQNVSLSAAGSSSIYFTTDGTIPSCTSGTPYTSTISVATNTTISTLSCYPSSASSTVVSFNYVINIPLATPPTPPVPSGGGGGGGSSAATTGSIAGLVYSDANFDGAFNASDTPLSGWVVYLDANNNGVLNATETSQTTLTNGLYNFTNLPFGTYTVREVPQTGFGQTEPAANLGHSYSVSLTANIPNATARDFGNNNQGKVLAATTSSAHPDGTLVQDGSTIYIISNGQLHGFRDPQEFASYGYKFTQAVPINAADKLLTTGDIMKAMVGTLTLDTSDNRTVYMVGQNYTKRGFASYAVFQGLGYSKGSSTSGQPVNGMFKINLTDYPDGTPITSATDAHPEGALVKDSNGTVWWILGGQKDGFESMDVFTSYGFTFDRVVVANAADVALPQGPLVKFRDGTLISQAGVTYIISDGQKLQFATPQAFSSRGYNLSNVIPSDISSYSAGTTLQ